ncbi:MAG: HAMP domain-containing sensor histidine kinase [Bacillota bacterium]|jgi:signal transduction histidine kinase
MFRRLQWQFIMTNLTIMMVLFGALTLGAYILLEIKMLKHAEFFAKSIAAGINTGMMIPETMFDNGPKEPSYGKDPAPNIRRQPPLPPPAPLRGRVRQESFFFFIMVDPGGKVLDHSIRFPARSTQISQLARQMGRTAKHSGVVQVFHSKYFYYKTALQHTTGALMVFQDLKQDQQNQYSLVIALAMIGSAFMVLALCGSIFIARRAVEPIQKAWRQQKDFLADASHELRNPLAVIQTNLEVIRGNQEETVAEQREWLDNIQDELRQMTGLVGSLLFLARIDSHQLVMENKRFDLDVLLVRVCEAFKPVMVARNLNLATFITKKIAAYGDAAAFRQVAENLLDNAVRHTPAGGTITVNLEQTAKRIVLTVADNGEGIAPQHLPKIFDRFYQVDSSRSKGKSGLGLAIVKSIVESNNGTIHAASQPGVGTTFTIYLPMVG